MSIPAEEQENLIEFLGDSDGYKENVRSFKYGVKHENAEKVSIIIEASQKILTDKTKHSPVIQLNCVRLIKECFDLNNFDFIDQIEDKILPILYKIAQFQKNNPKLDRGKDYFQIQQHKGIDNIEVIGNSFIRLVLECIVFWAKWLPLTKFAQTHQELVEQKVIFPIEFNYFKAELAQSVEDQIKKKYTQRTQKAKQLSEIKEMTSKLNNNDSSAQSPQNAKSKEKFQFGLSNDKINHNNHTQRNTEDGEKQNHYESPFVEVNRAIQNIKQIKETLIEGLSKPQAMDVNLLNYFREEFQKFTNNAENYSQRLIDDRQADGTEDLLGSLFNENEFAELFIKNCTSYLNNKTNWKEFQKPFENHFKKQQFPKQNSLKYGEGSQTIDYVSIRMQPNMLASDNQMNIQAKGFSLSKQDVNHKEIENDETEKTIQINDQFTNDNKMKILKANQLDKDYHEEEKEEKNYKRIDNNKEDNGKFINETSNNGQFYYSNTEQKLQDNEPYSQQRRDDFRRHQSERNTLKSALNKSESDKYKFQLKSNTNFYKGSSANNSNLSNTSITSRKPIISRHGQQQKQANQIFNLEGTPEELQARLQEAMSILQNLNKEKELFMNKYQAAQSEIDDLVSKVAKQSNNKDKEKHKRQNS